MKNNGINQNKKGPTYGCPQGALEMECEGDVQHPHSDEEQVAQSSHWPRLVENFQPARHHSNQPELNTKRKLDVEVESWILDEEAKPGAFSTATLRQTLAVSNSDNTNNVAVGVLRIHGYAITCNWQRFLIAHTPSNGDSTSDRDLVIVA